MTAASFTTAALAALLMAAAAPARADAFDFEDVAPNMYTAGAIPAGYAGADWSGFVLRRSSDFWNSSSGGFVLNGSTMAWGISVAPQIDFRAPVRFDGAFVGSYSVGGTSTLGYTLWLDGVQVAAQGPLGYHADYLPSNYAGAIDRIQFQVGPGDRLTFDNLNVSAVPEPSAWALMAGGLLAVAGWHRRRGRKAC